MPPFSVYDYAIPFDIMVGEWEGLVSYYDVGKTFQFSTSQRSHQVIYWKKFGEILCFRELDFAVDPAPTQTKASPDLQQKLQTVRTINSFLDLTVNGQTATGKGDNYEIDGFETNPGLYLFHVVLPNAVIYNHQHFIDPNLRRITGPYVERGTDGGPGKVTQVISQVFTRISYTVQEQHKTPPQAVS
jgi:hypothetical protein